MASFFIAPLIDAENNVVIVSKLAYVARWTMNVASPAMSPRIRQPTIVPA